MTIKKINLLASIEISYYPYKNKKKNKKAETDIVRWVRSSLEDINYIPLYIEREENGSAIEDITQKARIKIWTKKRK